MFSHTLESVDWNSRLERGDPVEVVRKLKAETDGRLEVAGATLAAPIVQAGLVDEYRIVVAPTAVGGGTPFFPTLPSWISLRLLENRTFRGGCGPAALRGDTRLIDMHSQVTCGCTSSSANCYPGNSTTHFLNRKALRRRVIRLAGVVYAHQSHATISSP